MDPITLSLLAKGGNSVAAGAPEAFKTALGISQAIKANRIARQTKRPAYEIPGAVKESVAMGREMAATGMPGYEQYKAGLGGQTANAVRSIKEAGGSGPEKLAAISGAYGSQMGAQTQLGIQNSQARMQNVRSLQGELGRLGQYQDKAWQWNQQDPYVQAMESARRLREGANQNIYGGMKGMASAAILGGEDEDDTTGGSAKKDWSKAPVIPPFKPKNKYADYERYGPGMGYNFNEQGNYAP
jgi:hypothetical protein